MFSSRGVRFCSFVAGAVASTASFAAVTQETEDFNTNPAARGWTYVENETTNNRHDFGWKASGNVNGSAGEAGGLFGRTETLASFTDVSGTPLTPLTLQDPWSAAVDFKIINLNGNARFVLGWFTSDDASGTPTNDTNGLPTPLLGVRLTRSSSTALELNLRSQTPGGSNSADLVPATAVFGPAGTVNTNNQVYRLNMTYRVDDPDTAGVVDPVLEARLRNVADLNTNLYFVKTLVSLGSGSDTINFDRFGFRNRMEAAQDSGSSTIYFDNFNYTVGAAIPEPASLSLLALGGLMLGRRRRA